MSLDIDIDMDGWMDGSKGDAKGWKWQEADKWEYIKIEEVKKPSQKASRFETGSVDLLLLFLN